MEKKQVTRVALWSFVIGVLMIIVSFALPPTGVVDPTVMRAAGMIFTFGAVVDSLYSNKIIRITHKDTQVYLGDKDDE